MDTLRNPVRRIVVADDYEGAAEAAVQLLYSAGYDAHAVHDGQQAVAASREFSAHCVILDLDMPLMNGYEAAAAIRAADPHGVRTLLVALSCDANSAALEKARRAGFDHHLAKPALDLPRSIDTLFERSDAHKG